VVKTAFQETGHKLSSRDCKAMAVSALTGLVNLYWCLLAG